MDSASGMTGGGPGTIGNAALDGMANVAPAAGESGRFPPGYATTVIARPTANLPSVQPFYFQRGIQVFATDGGGIQTESVDGFDVTTVDARHHRTVHPSGFFEPHDGGRYDRVAVANFWPLRLGKQVKFVEKARDGQWLHTMRVVRGELVALPAGSFDTFVVERTTKGIGRTQFSATYTYWYAPAAGAIVRSEVRQSGSRSEILEAAILGRPLQDQDMETSPTLGETATGDGRGGTPFRR